MVTTKLILYFINGIMKSFWKDTEKAIDKPNSITDYTLEHMDIVHHNKWKESSLYKSY